MSDGSPQTQPVVLVVSTGRTGTKALATHLSACYRDVIALHEPPPTRFLLRRTQNRFLCGRISKEKLVKILAENRPQPLAAGHSLYVESNPGLSGFLDAFPAVFPEFKVLHVVRDPRTYIASALNWGVFRGVKGLFAKYLPYWLPKPELANPAGPTWSRMTPVEKLAWHWTFINEHLDRARTLYPGRYLRIKFEDLFARDGSGLAEAVKWMGLPPMDGLALAANSENVNASRPGKAVKWRDWPDDDKRAALRYCAPLMRAYGYDLSADAHLVDADKAAVTSVA
jgi:hypothetical protein